MFYYTCGKMEASVNGHNPEQLWILHEVPFIAHECMDVCYMHGRT